MIWIISAVVAALLLFLSWPTRLDVRIVNEKGDPVIAGLDIGGDMRVSNQVSFYLWKDTSDLNATSVGYTASTTVIKNPISFFKRRAFRLVMHPEMIPLSRFTYLDPTGTLSLHPVFEIEGRTIQGDLVKKNLTINNSIPYGSYAIKIHDDDFTGSFIFDGDSFTSETRLMPDGDFIMLSDEDARYALNYLDDFISLHGSLPKQFYLYKESAIVTLGQLLFLHCVDAINSSVYFYPKKSAFSFGDGVSDESSCYDEAIKGQIPSNLGRMLTGSEIVPPLNQKKRGPDIAFTFDVESGRYVPYNTSPAVSPCENANFSLGLNKDEIICDYPALVAWMSPVKGDVTYTEFPYPQVSGILGFKEILDFSERYGVPTTDYFVLKDLRAFDILDPDLTRRAKALIDDGLMEAGSHTRYHTDLSAVDETVAMRELVESKKDIESFFDTTIYGFRSPYLSIIKDPATHAKAVSDAGYKYYSQAQDWYVGKVPGLSLIDKNWNTVEYLAYMDESKVIDLVAENGYLITLDHPWDLFYDDGAYLLENPENAVQYRKNLLTTISEGAIPAKAKDMRLVYPIGD